MPNEIPETEVRGTLLVDIPRAEKKQTNKGTGSVIVHCRCFLTGKG